MVPTEKKKSRFSGRRSLELYKARYNAVQCRHQRENNTQILPKYHTGFQIPGDRLNLVELNLYFPSISRFNFGYVAGDLQPTPIGIWEVSGFVGLHS